jgi:hypothetical protein
VKLQGHPPAADAPRLRLYQDLAALASKGHFECLVDFGQWHFASQQRGHIDFFVLDELQGSGILTRRKAHGPFYRKPSQVDVTDRQFDCLEAYGYDNDSTAFPHQGD